MCPSGVDEFPQVKQDDLEIAFQRLQGSSATILVFTYFIGYVILREY